MVKFQRMYEYPILQKCDNFTEQPRTNTIKTEKTENVDFGAVDKCANLVDLEKCWKINMWLQKSVLMQPRKEHLKFGLPTPTPGPPLGRTNSHADAAAAAAAAEGYKEQHTCCLCVSSRGRKAAL